MHRSSCCTRSRPTSLEKPIRAGVAVTAGDSALLAGLVAETGQLGNAATLDVELEVETGLGRGGFSGDRLLEAARTIQDATGLRLAGLWTHLQAVEDPELTALQLRAVRGRLDRAGRNRRRPATPPRRRECGDARGRDRGRTKGSGPASRSTDSSPTSSKAPISRSTATPGSRPSWPCTPGPSAWKPCRRAGGSATGRPSGRGGRAASRPSRSAMATAGRAPCRTVPRRWSEGSRVPLVGNVAMDAVMADVTDVPGAPVDGGRRVRPARAIRETSGSPRPTWRTSATRTAGKSSPAWLAGYPGCTMRRPDRSVCGRSPSEESSWRASKSGTATSAIWRSTRS